MKYLLALFALTLSAFGQSGTPNFSTIRATTGTIGRITVGTSGGGAILTGTSGTLYVGGVAVGTGGGGGGTPGGSSGQIQYNNAGSFGGLDSSGTGDVLRVAAGTASSIRVGTGTGGVTLTGTSGSLYIAGKKVPVQDGVDNTGDLSLSGNFNTLHGGQFISFSASDTTLTRFRDGNIFSEDIGSGGSLALQWPTLTAADYTQYLQLASGTVALMNSNLGSSTITGGTITGGTASGLTLGTGTTNLLGVLQLGTPGVALYGSTGVATVAAATVNFSGNIVQTTADASLTVGYGGIKKYSIDTSLIYDNLGTTLWGHDWRAGGTSYMVLTRYGFLGVGTGFTSQYNAATAPQSAVHAKTIGNQLRLDYGTANKYSDISTGSGGNLTVSLGTAGARVFHAANWLTVSSGSASSFATVGIGTGKTVGAVFAATLLATGSAGELQSQTSHIYFDAVNATGTASASISQVDNTAAASTGTLTVAYSAVATGTSVALKITPTTSLGTSATVKIKFSGQSIHADPVTLTSP